MANSKVSQLILVQAILSMESNNSNNKYHLKLNIITTLEWEQLHKADFLI